MRKPADGGIFSVQAILRFFATCFTDASEPRSMSHRDAALLGGAITVTCIVVALALVVVGRPVCSMVPRESQNMVAMIFTLLTAAFAIATFVAVLTVASELLDWQGDVQFAKFERRRHDRYEAKRRTRPPAASPAPSKTTDEVLTDLTNHAMQMRDEAFHEAARIASILNRIHEEIFNERQR